MIRFLRYDHALRLKIGGIPGAIFKSEAQGGPGFSIQMDLQTCHELRRSLGQQIEFSDEILEWGRKLKEESERLTNIATAKTATSDLSVLQAKLAGRERWDYNEQRYRPIWDMFREDQKVGVQFFNECPHPLIADEAGLGKTWEIIGGVLNAGTEAGANIVICPKISIENVWLQELNLFQDEVVFVAPEGRKQRDRLLKEVAECREEEIPFWLIVNFQMVGLKAVSGEEGGEFYDHRTEKMLRVQFPFLFDVEWNNLIIDETHLSGLPNPSSQFSRAVRMMQASKRVATSGTPLGGKPERLWGTLNWLDPVSFNAKHTWAKRWIKSRTFETPGGDEVTTYSDLKKSLEEQFYKEHRQYILRRTKLEVMPWLPDFTPVDIWVDKTPAQAKQYDLMEQEAMANVFESEQHVGHISMTNVLQVNTWLKQFAFGYCELVERDRVWNDFTDAWEIKYRAMPTEDSPKLKAILEKLQEIGADDPGSGEQVVIFTQFKETANLITKYLRSQKFDGKPLKVAKITGDVSKRTEREQIVQDFQKGGEYQIIVMTTKSGGVSINLDRANSVFFVDEDWDPDVQTQAKNRCLRASRIHKVTVYTFLTRKTIDHDVRKKVQKKQNVNDILLDRFRKLQAGEDIYADADDD